MKEIHVEITRNYVEITKKERNTRRNYKLNWTTPIYKEMEHFEMVKIHMEYGIKINHCYKIPTNNSKFGVFPITNAYRAR